MIRRSDLLALAEKRLRDSEVLFAGRRYEGACYLCGYAVELALKASICKTLGWPGFPDTSAEFKDLVSLKTHSLDVLVKLSGQERRVKKHYLGEWSVVTAWSPAIRYGPPQPIRKTDARNMLDSAREITRVLRS